MSELQGQTLKGKYQLDELLGSGGMGQVYRARNVLVDRTVAIKVLRAEFLQNAQVVERFMREAKAANVVRHRNIVDVLDIDKTDDGTMFIVQEYLEGEDLAARLEARPGGLPPGEALDVLIPVVEAVGAAHASGVVHRDLKPDNVFLSSDGEDLVPKVLDFGISKTSVQDKMRRTALGVGAAPKGVRLTAVGAAMGTPLYMSPEQIKDPASVDPRGDVWSLGVMLYETLSGRMPFNADSLAGLFAEICSREPVPLERVAPQVPSELARVVHRCLRPERAERYDDATSLAERLRRCRLLLGEQAAAARGHRPHIPTIVSVPPPPAGEPSEVNDATLPATEMHSRDRPRARPFAGSPESSDFGLELDLPSEASPGGAAGVELGSVESAGTGAAIQSSAVASSHSKRAAPPDKGSPFGVFDDDDDDEVSGLNMELSDGELAPAGGARLPRPRVAASARQSAGSVASSPAPGSSPRSRVALTGKAALPSPSMLGEVVRTTVAVGLCAALAVLAPHAAPAKLSTAHLTMGGDGFLPFAATALVMVAVVIWLVQHAARWGFASLFVTALTSLALAIASGIVAVVLGVPGIVGGTVRMVAVFAMPWAAVGVTAGFTAYAVGRAQQLLRTRGARSLGTLFVVMAVLCAAAGLWIVRQPLPTVAAVSQMRLVPLEAETSARVRQVAVTLVGARAIHLAPPPPAAPSPRSGGAAAAALHRSAAP